VTNRAHCAGAAASAGERPIDAMARGARRARGRRRSDPALNSLFYRSRVRVQPLAVTAAEASLLAGCIASDTSFARWAAGQGAYAAVAAATAATAAPPRRYAAAPDVSP
jgi:hypothetical protein